MSHDHQHCSGGQCSSGHSHHHHHEHDHECCCGHHHHECCDHHEGDFAHQLLEMADEAWMEILKDKLKKHIETQHGSHLEGLAKIVAESNSSRWKHKLGLKKLCHTYEEQIQAFFSQEK